MANTLRIKRRASGSPGAPSTLNNAELAYNEVDDILYFTGLIDTFGEFCEEHGLEGEGLVH